MITVGTGERYPSEINTLVAEDTAHHYLSSRDGHARVIVGFPQTGPENANLKQKSDRPTKQLLDPQFITECGLDI